MRSLKLTFLFLFFITSTKAQTKSVLYDDNVVVSKILNSNQKYSIYLPPGYESSREKYPILYLLHPAGPSNTIPNHQSWYKYGLLKDYLDKAIESGEIKPMIVVTPDANFEKVRISYFNDPAGDFNFESYFFDEFIPYIESNYRCDSRLEKRGIAGASLGGGAALQYALRRPDLFSVSISLSGAVRKFDLPYLKNRYKNVNDDDLQLWFKKYNIFELFKDTPKTVKTKWFITCGDDDMLSVNNADLHSLLRAEGINHEFRINDGRHDWDYWKRVTPYTFKYISSSFE